MVGFGIDLSGFSTGRSACAVATRTSGAIQITILSGCPFSTPRDASSPLNQAVAPELRFLKQMLARGPTAVDIPIDLQGLPFDVPAREVWELTKRPVDRALGALPPLADKIGAPVARFRNLVDAGGLRPRLGKTLFETYPGATRRRLGLSDRRDLGFGQPTDGQPLNEDEFDAGLCALTAMLTTDRLAGPELQSALAERFDRLSMARRDLPLGYILLKRIPEEPIIITRRVAGDWAGEN